MSTLPPPDTRAIVGRHVADLLRELTDAGSAVAAVRVADAAGGLACLVLVWPADGRMPVAREEVRRAVGVSGAGPTYSRSSGRRGKRSPART